MSFAGIAGYRGSAIGVNWRWGNRVLVVAVLVIGGGSVLGTFGSTPAKGGSLNGSAPRCEHVDAIVLVDPVSDRCLNCHAAGEDWVSLMVCLTCGWVACSDDSPQAHARAHYQETDHPIAAALRPGSKFRWCYVHRRAV